ncbi:UNVERIFIED_CONTAM: hypothetical protein Sangu_0832100 [Sesamum angustifolium]|uniref:Uncharacterized protein n=1 Tax=Sesamum angustifolium TaxID=2727405 RepID=A0AAW2PWD6_9LAMI
MEDKNDMQVTIKEHIDLGLIENGVSTYSNPGFLDLVKYKKDFQPLLKKMKSSKPKLEEIHSQRVRELKQIYSNLSKRVIPQDGDELVVYTDTNDYKWAAGLMKKTTTGEEARIITGGLFS